MLAEYLGGRLDDPSIRRHVEGCDLCKARLRDERLLRAMLGPGGAGVDGDHLDDEILAAYVDQRLELSRMREIDRHLAHCDECLADAIELKKLVDAPTTTSLPPHLHDLAVEALGVRTLGTLYLSVDGNRVFAFYMTEAEHDPQVSMRRPVPPPRGANAASTRTLQRMASYRDDSRPPARFANVAASIPPRAVGEPSAGDADGPSGSLVSIPVDESLSLEIVASPCMLELRAIKPGTGEPLAGVVIRFEYGEHGGHARETDREGQAVGKLPPADVPLRIVLPGPPACAIDIQVS